jgi:succinate-semialdehyde dehydrogenase/glutarate-semialdehyde dehydrogenase
MKSINPATGKEYNKHPNLDPSHVKRRIKDGQQSFLKWRKFPFEARAFKMRELADMLEFRKHKLAKLITKEMGKLYTESISEIEKCAWVCNYYAENAQSFLTDEKIKTDASQSFITYQPLGLLLAIMPWNFPFWQVFRFAAPALMAGNGAILKHASNVPGCALAIENLFKNVGFPEHLFQTFLISNDEVKSIIKHPYVKAVSLTGSEFAGSAVAELSGHYIKKAVLELGGNDAYIILKDASLKSAVDECVKARMLNCGQSCIAAKRFIVDASVYHDFVSAVRSKMKKYTNGDPMKESTTLAPIARKDLRKTIMRQVKKSVALGARLTLGGKNIPGNGYYFEPTILEDVQPGMPAFDDEIFGPVASIIRAKNEKHAIQLANSSRFGLGAAIFTSDIKKGRSIARDQLNAGSCFVNGMVKSDPRLPFGGIGLSGYGRELSEKGILEFVNTKTVWVK